VLAAQGADKLFVTTDLFRRLPAGVRARAVETAFTQKVAALSQFDPSVRLLVRSFVAPRRSARSTRWAASSSRRAARARRSRRRGHLGGHVEAHRDLVARALAGDAEGGARTRGPGRSLQRASTSFS